jgi:hypothetical protein
MRAEEGSENDEGRKEEEEEADDWNGKNGGDGGEDGDEFGEGTLRRRDDGNSGRQPEGKKEADRQLAEEQGNWPNLAEREEEGST